MEGENFHDTNLLYWEWSLNTESSCDPLVRSGEEPAETLPTITIHGNKIIQLCSALPPLVHPIYLYHMRSHDQIMTTNIPGLDFLSSGWSESIVSLFFLLDCCRACMCRLVSDANTFCWSCDSSRLVG